MVQQTNQLSGVVDVVPFDDLLTKPEVIWSDKIDESKGETILFRSPSLSQVNIFKYTEDEDLSFPSNDGFAISDDNLPISGNVLTLPFAASDGTIAGSNIAAARIRLFSREEVTQGLSVSVGARFGIGFHAISLDQENLDIQLKNDYIIINETIE